MGPKGAPKWATGPEMGPEMGPRNDPPKWAPEMTPKRALAACAALSAWMLRSKYVTQLQTAGITPA